MKILIISANTLLTSPSGPAYVAGAALKAGHTVEVFESLFAEDLDATALPAYELFDLDQYFDHNISCAIFTKRGCAFSCTFCPYRSLEGVRYRLKSPTRVVDEIEHIQSAKNPKMFTFCDNSFNVPKKHAEAICKEII